MKLKSITFILATTLLSTASWADANVNSNNDSQNLKDSVTPSAESMNQKVVKSSSKKNDQGNIDQEITNARMRANSGSKSKLSTSISLGYSGGSIGNPFGKERPDIYGNPENETLTSIGGSLSGRYRFNKNDSITLGVGVSYLAPLRSDNNPNRNQFNIDNPDFSYNRVQKLGIFQTTSSIGYTYGTSVAWKGAQLQGVLSFGHNLLTTIGNSGLTVGAAFGLSLYDYKDSAQASDPRTSYNIGIYPYLEYTLSDKYSLRTVLGFLNYEHTRQDSNQSVFAMKTSPSYQSVGLGIAVSRDIYIYPNIQFLPKDFEAKKTNVAISASINI